MLVLTVSNGVYNSVNSVGFRIVLMVSRIVLTVLRIALVVSRVVLMVSRLVLLFETSLIQECI